MLARLIPVSVIPFICQNASHPSVELRQRMLYVAPGAAPGVGGAGGFGSDSRTVSVTAIVCDIVTWMLVDITVMVPVWVPGPCPLPLTFVTTLPRVATSVYPDGVPPS